MSFGRKLLNVLLVMLLLFMLFFGLSEHYLDDVLNLIALGGPLWIFLILVLLIVHLVNQRRILRAMDIMYRKMDQAPYYQDETPPDDQ